MGQMLVRGGDPTGNLNRAEEMVRRAAVEGCSAVVLPEALDFGWTHPSARHADSGAVERLSQAAARFSVYVVAGYVERQDNARLLNSAVLISPAGEVLLRHRKLNELSIARDLYTLGDSLNVAETEIGRVGLLICADLFPTSLVYAEALARMGAQWILSPCAWAVDADHDNVREPYGDLWDRSYGDITRRYPLTVVGVSNVGWLDAGPWAGKKCIGCSLAMGPGGKVLARGSYGDDAEQLLIVEAPLGPPVFRYAPDRG